MNPSKELNDLWKINRDTLERGKTKSDVEAQIKEREIDSDTYISSQIKFADLIIETLVKDGSSLDEEYDYRIIFPNSLSVNSLLKFFAFYPEVSLDHKFIHNDLQELLISGEPTSEMIEKFLNENIIGLSELGILDSRIEPNTFGLMVVTISFLIFEAAKVE